jgi:TrwC relaxase
LRCRYCECEWLQVPIVSVTPLGSDASGVGAAVGQIIDYLYRGTRRPEPNMSISGYYADTPNSPGVWRGRGVNAEQLTGPVDTEAFRRVLEGNHPTSGERLVAASGSAGRAQRDRPAIASTGPNDELLSTDQVANLLGVTDRYVRMVATDNATDPKKLLGHRVAGDNWVFRRDDLERFAANRKEQKVVVAYDVTVSFEKSISLVWARANPEQRRTIEKALDAGTNAAVAYLEDQALAVRRGRSAVKADGVWAASFRHMTNRNLEPQLHDHVVIANIGASDGRTQALDSRLHVGVHAIEPADMLRDGNRIKRRKPVPRHSQRDVTNLSRDRLRIRAVPRVSRSPASSLVSLITEMLRHLNLHPGLQNGAHQRRQQTVRADKFNLIGPGPSDQRLSPTLHRCVISRDDLARQRLGSHDQSFPGHDTMPRTLKTDHLHKLPDSPSSGCVTKIV